MSSQLAISPRFPGPRPVDRRSDGTRQKKRPITGHALPTLSFTVCAVAINSSRISVACRVSSWVWRPRFLAKASSSRRPSSSDSSSSQAHIPPIHFSDRWSADSSDSSSPGAPFTFTGSVSLNVCLFWIFTVVNDVRSLCRLFFSRGHSFLPPLHFCTAPLLTTLCMQELYLCKLNGGQKMCSAWGSL